MRVHSFMRAQGELAPVEVEVSLSPGLPQFHFLGLPDAAIRESEMRVKAALRSQGFESPRAHQTIVHLRPSHLRKTSRGIDLAVAAAVLWETGQAPRPKGERAPMLYGELSLSGEIHRPDDFDEIESALDGRPVLTGPGPAHHAIETWSARSLRDLARPCRMAAVEAEPEPVRPAFSRVSWPKPAAELLAVLAAGEHPCVVAGPPGSGKTSLAEAVIEFMSPPSPSEMRQARIIARAQGYPAPLWRPFVQPHHSSSALAVIGGGVPPRPGEITRAHGGILVLDELLEFPPAVQEALREPLESGVIRLARAGAVRTFPARFAVVSTTNLCHCGKLDPDAPSLDCACPAGKRERYLARLSGPFLDRAQILAFSGRFMAASDPMIPSGDLLARTQRAQAMRLARGQTEPNARAPIEAIESTLSADARAEAQERWDAKGASRSMRRQLAIARVARTLADLEGEEKTSAARWTQALRWSSASFDKLASRI